jgi:hypothetical protein
VHASILTPRADRLRHHPQARRIDRERVIVVGITASAM